MKPGALFLNLSRGFLVDLDAVTAALKSGHLGGVGLDVFPDEPKKKGDPFSSPLQGAPNTILTPHIGGSTEEAQRDIGQFVASRLRDYLFHGSTSLSVNTPNLSLAQPQGRHRIAYLHTNTPGVLADVNAIFAAHGVNIESQLLGTRGDYGYVVTDIASDVPAALRKELEALEATVRLRVLS